MVPGFFIRKKGFYALVCSRVSRGAIGPVEKNIFDGEETNGKRQTESRGSGSAGVRSEEASARTADSSKRKRLICGRDTCG